MTGTEDSGPLLALAVLGVPAEEELLYRVLLGRPRASAGELAPVVGWRVERVRRRVRALEQRGLVTREVGRPARFTAAPPGPVVELLALQRREEVERARLAASVLSAEFRMDVGSGAVFQVLGGPAAVAQRFAQLQRSVRDELLVLDRPPQVVRRELLRPGVRHRAIYDHRCLRTPEQLSLSRESARFGEEGRVLAEAPLRFVVADRRTALVPLPPRGEALVLHSSVLVDGLVALYELLWQRSVPLWPGRSEGERARSLSGLSRDDEHLLALSASGLTDRAVARRLGVAQRTVERRMRRIMDLLGARTRLQAGLQAALQGVIGQE